VNFDTSRVTNMDHMFRVHFARLPCAQTPVEPSLARCMRGRHPTDRPPCASRPAPRPTSYAQDAKGFNQPVNFDTSRVTGMIEMFKVHSARTLRSDPV